MTQELLSLRQLRDRLRIFLEKARKDGIEINSFQTLLRECDCHSETPIIGSDWISSCGRLTAEYSTIEQEGIEQIAWIVTLDGKYLGLFNTVPMELLNVPREADAEQYRLENDGFIRTLKEIQQSLQQHPAKFNIGSAVAIGTFGEDELLTPEVGIVIGLHTYEETNEWAYLVMTVDQDGDSCEAEWIDESDLRSLHLVSTDAPGAPLLTQDDAT